MNSSPQSNLSRRVSDELLPRVRQPAQYIGREINQLVRDGDWQRAELRVAIAFPDTYAVGICHLGCQIIYWLCNQLPGVCAERVYCPWVDAERVMRDRRIGLFTWDTRQPVAQADILAVSIQHEMCYTNVLTLLDLAGIPLRASDRHETHPLVLAGGIQADNPEPLADFLDLVVIGDAEGSLPALLEAYRQLKRRPLPRREIIIELARRFEWLYAPALYDVSYNPDGTIAQISPNTPGIAPTVLRCRTRDLEQAPLPEWPLLPYVQPAQDRISIEIMRGCPHRCRFCQVGYTRAPLALRSVQRIVEIAEQAWQATGHEQIGLLSLSSADYPHLKELAEQINRRFAARQVNISLPSLRIDKTVCSLPPAISSVRKSGLTLAPETASDQLRQVIGKRVTNDALFEALRAAYRAGWRSVKLYFICGLPGETDDDIAAIFDLARHASDLRRQDCGRPANINVSVSWLVPMPHTPLQWAAQPTATYFRRARRILRQLAGRTRAPVRLRFHNIERSILEAVFARGDRRLGAVIETAWRAGARFDAWDECFEPHHWHRAFSQAGLDPAWYAHRHRSFHELLPWQHLLAGLPHQQLRRHCEALLARIGPPQQAPSTGTT